MDDSDFTMAFAWRSFSIGIDKLIADARSKNSANVDLLTQARDLAQKIMLGPENQNIPPAAVRYADDALRCLEELQVLREENSTLKTQVAAAKNVSEPKNSHLLAIAGMLRLLQDSNRPRYNQDSIARAIECLNWRGASHSGLTKLFAEAKKAAEDAESNAKF